MPRDPSLEALRDHGIMAAWDFFEPFIELGEVDESRLCQFFLGGIVDVLFS